MQALKKILYIATVVVFFQVNNLSAQLVGIDSTFSTNGFFSFGDPNGKEIFSGMVRQADGKIVLVGETDYDPDEGGNKRGIIVRLNTNGTLDNTFGTNGVVYIDSPGDSDDVETVQIQSDGKILLAGYTEPKNNNSYVWSTIIRLNPNGSFDNSFGDKGICLVTSTLPSHLWDVKIDAEGKIVASGFAVPPGAGHRPFVCRVNTNGRLDTSFAHVGFLTINNFGNFAEGGLGVAIQSDGKIVLLNNKEGGGTFGTYVTTLIRLNKNGTFDTGFGSSGNGSLTVKDQQSELDFPKKIAIDSENRIVFSGSASTSQLSSRWTGMFVRRLLPNGNFDNSFGTNGKVNYDLNPNTSIRDEAFGMAINPNGEIYLTGFIKDNELAVVKFNQNGSLDTRFAPGGLWKKTIGAGAVGATAGLSILLDDQCMYIAGMYAPTANDQNGFTLHLCDKTVAVAGKSIKLTSNGSYINAGDLDISGNQITVEATILMTDLNANDIISKHSSRLDNNYLLRPYSFEISTSTGFYNLKVPFIYETNKWYHVAATYDGSIMKYYVNGCLVSQVAATGNLILNDLSTKIGYNYTFVDEQFYGNIDEVKIWNITRTQAQIQETALNLSSPSTQTGLKLYYKFSDSYTNLQGDAAFSGTPVGSPTFSPAEMTTLPTMRPLTEGLLAHYPFSGNANDASGKNNNGIISGATLTSDRFGNADQAYQFGVEKYIKVPHSSSLVVSNMSSMSAWIYVETFTPPFNSIVMKSSPNINGAGDWGITFTPNLIYYSGNIGGSYFESRASQALSLGKWYHVVSTYDGTAAKFFLDGKLIAEQKLSGNLDQGNRDLFIGAHPDGSPEWLQGKLDDIRIYNRALSPCEVEDLYQTERPANPSPGTDKVQLYLSKATASDTARITVRANNFKDIGGFQFSVAIPTGKARIVGIDQANSFAGLLLRQKTPERWGFIWYDPNLAAKTLPDSSVLVTLKVVFNTNVAENECLPIVFDIDPTDIVVSTLINQEVGEYIPSTANGEVCLLSTARLKGKIINTAGLGVNAVRVNIGGKISTSNDKGEYEMPQLLRGRTYVIKPFKTGAHKNGVNVVDVVTIRQHILGDKTFADPYRYIVSDVNNSGSVNVADVVIIQQLILGQIDSFSRNWVFVPADFRFSSPAGAIKEKFPEEITITNLDGDKNEQNFIGLKMGDANNSASPKGRFASPPGWVMPALTLQAGEQLNIPVYARGLEEIRGFQCQLKSRDIAQLELVGIVAGDQTLLKPRHFDLSQGSAGVINVLWVEELQSEHGLNNDRPLFFLKVRAKAQHELGSLLYFDQRDFENQFVDAALDWREGSLSFSQSTAIDEVNGQRILHYVYPNPSKNEANLLLITEISTASQVEILDLSGRMIQQYWFDIKPGLNRLPLNDLPNEANGVYLYRLKIEGQKLNGQFLLLHE